MSSYTRQFAINGVIDTNKSVMQNLNTIASAAGAWVTFDVNAGLWSLVINQPGTSVKSFTDDNIVGPITVTNTGLTELYNSVELTFPHRDLLDQVDTITFSIPEIDRYENEQDNVLNFKFDCINDPVQAELLAARELKQSRVDQVISFSTDFSSLGLKAGDLIDITSTIYGYTQKIYRILTIAEEDGGNGEILLNITAYEYSADVFSTDGLEREVRTTQNTVSSECANTALQNSNQAATTNNLIASLGGPAAISLLLSLLNSMGRKTNAGSPGGYTPGLVSQVYSAEQADILLAGNNTEEIFNVGSVITLPYTGTYKLSYNLNWGGGGDDPNEAAFVPFGIKKLVEILISINSGANVSIADTGDAYEPLYADQFLEGFFTASAGNTLQPKLSVLTNYPNAYTLPAGYPAPPATPAGWETSITPTITLQYVGAA